jgi:hypothetical protein
VLQLEAGSSTSRSGYISWDALPARGVDLGLNVNDLDSSVFNIDNVLVYIKLLTQSSVKYKGAMRCNDVHR